jgi:hypothetical protein
VSDPPSASGKDAESGVPTLLKPYQRPGWRERAARLVGRDAWIWHLAYGEPAVDFADTRRRHCTNPLPPPGRVGRLLEPRCVSCT